MGFCFSCCRRRPKNQDRSTDAERQQLLRSQSNDARMLPEKRTPFEGLTDILAALHSGKLPSQQQLDTALQKLLRTDFFRIDSSVRESGTFDESMKNTILDARETVQALLQFGLEKNDDNRLQDLIYQLRELSTQTVPVNVEAPVEVQVSSDAVDKIQTAASAIPSQNELALDTSALLSSLRTLATLLLTSEAFRLIIGDLLLTARQLVADTAVQVRRVAETVEHVSEAVEVNVRPGSDIPVVQPIVGEKQQTGARNPQPTGTEETRDPKEVVLNRIEDIFRRAQASSSYNSALRTLLFIFRKYAERVSIASNAISEATQSTPGDSSIQLTAPVIVPDPRFARALRDLREILERLASGRSLEPLLQTLFKAVHDISVIPAIGDNNEIQVFFRDVGQWLDTALANPSFVSSRAGRDGAAKLYDKWSQLLSQDTQLSEDIHHLLDEASSFTDAIRSDKTTSKLFNSIMTLHSDIPTLLGQTTQKGKHAAQHWRSTLIRLFLGWLLPRILRAVRVIPMPRVVYVSQTSNGPQIAVAIDALFLSAEEALVPDVLSVQEFTEVRVEVDEDVGAAELTSPNARLGSARKMVDQNRHDGDLEDALHVPLLGNGSELLNPNPTPDLSQGKRSNVTSTSRVRVHIEGLRLAAHDVGYYASYARTPSSWLGYADEGILSIDIGHNHRRGEGLTLDVELEIDTGTETTKPKGVTSRTEANGSTEDEEDDLFRISNVQSSLPGLTLRVKHSKHWILNSLLTPLVGPIGRSILPPILNAQVSSALEKIERVMRGVKGKANIRAEGRAREGEGNGEKELGVEDWWEALLEVFGTSGHEDVDSDQDSSDSEDEEQEIYTETYNKIGPTGIVHTTLSQPEPSRQTSEPPNNTENTLSVGLTSQLLPGKGEPTNLIPSDEDLERESPRDVAHEMAGGAREAIEDVRDKVKNVEGRVEEVGRKGVEEAVRVRRLVEDAGERVERVERRERRRGGWRSRAFDI